MTLSPEPNTRQPRPALKSGFTHESQRAGTVEWLTPGWIFEALGGVEFDLDPCSPGAEHTVVPARRHLTIEDDGLTTPWEGTVWCNPPYGREVAVWMRKLARHRDGIALVFSRTDTIWFQDAVADADLLCFLPGRVRFIDGRTGQVSDGSPGSGSVLIAYGDTATEAVRQSGLGLIMTRTAVPIK